MTEANQTGTQQRDRSPAFPVVALETALQRLTDFEVHFKRSAARPEKVGDAWKITTKAYADRIAAALRYFGLLEYQGTGKERSVTVSEEGRKYLRAQQEETKQEIIKRAALRPKQIATFWDLWGKDRPADAACIDELVQKHSFSVAGARDFLKVYDATISFAKLSDSDKVLPAEGESEEESEQSDMTPEVHAPPKPNTPPPPLPPAAPLRVVMNGDRLDIQASVDLEGLKKLRTMLEKYQGILEMLQPETDPDADILDPK